MLERDLEKWCRGKARERGCRFWKFTSPGVRGVPDRLLLSPGQVTFVELKGPRGKVGPQQHKRLRELQALGLRAEVIISKEAFLELLDEVAPL